MPLLISMIVVGMKLPAIIFVAAGFAARFNETKTPIPLKERGYSQAFLLSAYIKKEIGETS